MAYIKKGFGRLYSFKGNSRLLFALILIFIVSCTTQVGSQQAIDRPIQQQAAATESQTESQDIIDWKEIELKDVVTGETFKISDFKGKPIFVETMAVWCPLCTRQQRELQKVAQELGDKVAHVSIDTDLNEDENLLRNYVNREGFEWPFAIDSQGRVGKQLVDKFGFNVANPPSTPVILIDENFNERLLRFGIKSSDELIAELNK